MQTNILEKVSINNSGQWLLVRGKNSNNPLILQIQAGPGLPMISEANMMEKMLGLEEDFLVAYWDQRGCGKSFDKKENLSSMNLDQLSEDLISCVKYLLKKYKKDNIILIGYSLGATISLLAAQKTPYLFSNIFLTGVDIDIPTANNFAMEFILDKAGEEKNKRWMKEGLQLKGVEINNAKLFQKRAKLFSNMGGIISGKSYNSIFFLTLKNMLFSREYQLKDILRTVQGMEFCQNALLPEINRMNLFEKVKMIEVPLHFIQGGKDPVAPIFVTRKYFDFLNCKSKSFTEFKEGGHLPHMEDPKRFAELIRTRINASACIVSGQVEKS